MFGYFMLGYATAILEVFLIFIIYIIIRRRKIKKQAIDFFNHIKP